MAEPAPLRTCARCHAAQYCSKACQVEAWPQHKLEVCDPVLALIAEFKSLGLTDMGPCSAAEAAEARDYHVPCEDVVFMTFRKVKSPSGNPGIIRLHLHRPGSGDCPNSADPATPATPPTFQFIITEGAAADGVAADGVAADGVAAAGVAADGAAADGVAAGVAPPADKLEVFCASDSQGPLEEGGPMPWILTIQGAVGGTTFEFMALHPIDFPESQWRALARGEGGIEFDYGYAHPEGKIVEFQAENCGNSDVDLSIGDGTDGSLRTFAVPLAMLTAPLLTAIDAATAAGLLFG